MALYCFIAFILAAGIGTGYLLLREVEPAEAETPAFDRVAFLKFLETNPAPRAADLKPFYRRPAAAPLRDPRWEPRREAMHTLGEKLFFDPRLSESGLMSCATCHNPVFHWTDRLPVSTENATRRSMSLYNLAWDKAFLWNGRAGTLMQQSLLALTAEKGMHASLMRLPQKLNQIPGYRAEFAKAYILPESDKSLITFTKVAAALEVFVTGIQSPPSAFDRWVEGDDPALSDSAIRGFELFNGKANCAQCHNSWRFSDSKVYNTGLESQCAEESIPNTAKSWNHGLFKAVGLREIHERSPYMHDGSLPTLVEVVQFYNRGGDARCRNTSKEIFPLGLSDDEVQDLVSFMESLGEGSRPYGVPALPH